MSDLDIAYTIHNFQTALKDYCEMMDELVPEIGQNLAEAAKILTEVGESII